MFSYGPGLALVVTCIFSFVEINAAIVPRGHSGLFPSVWQHRIHAPLVRMAPSGPGIDPTARACLAWHLGELRDELIEGFRVAVNYARDAEGAAATIACGGQEAVGERAGVLSRLRAAPRWRCAGLPQRRSVHPLVL